MACCFFRFISNRFVYDLIVSIPYFSLHSLCVLFFFWPEKLAPIPNRLSQFLYLLLPVATPSSQTLTQDGSSFESASSMYSLARVDAISDDGPLTAAPVEDTLPLPAPPSTKPSPSHSISSSSSGSFCLHGGGAKKPAIMPIPTSPRNSVVKVPISAIAAKQSKAESISEDEKSEKRYSSSGYYESPHDDGKYSHLTQFCFLRFNGYFHFGRTSTTTAFT